MTLATEAFRDLQGEITVDLNNKYAVDIVYGESYMVYQKGLIDLAARFDAGRFHNSLELAEKMMRRNMEAKESLTDVEIPSIMLFRKRGLRRDTLVGLATERVFLISTSNEGVVPLLYVSNRVFSEPDRGLHLGRTAIQQAIVVHKEATWLAHRTNTEVAAYSLARSGVFQEKRLHPWDSPFDTDPVAQELLTGLWYRVRNNATQPPDIATGISIAEYDEQNTANVLRPDHVPTMEFRARMLANGMDFARKDAQYAIGKLKGKLR